MADNFPPRLPAIMSSIIRRGLDDDFLNDVASHRVPEGPHFVYDDAPRLFSGRHGRGPLVVAWDTNILLDYFEYGRSLWNGDVLPDVATGVDYGEALEALQIVVAVWVLRDIRFQVFPRVIDDAAKAISGDRVLARQHAVRRFGEALHVASRSTPSYAASSPLLLGAPVVRRALRKVPAGGDRDLVEIAVASGSHVFLTRDHDVLRAAPELRPLGLLLASPEDLLEELGAAGGLHCLVHDRFAQFPIAHPGRVELLLDALPR